MIWQAVILCRLLYVRYLVHAHFVRFWRSTTTRQIAAATSEETKKARIEGTPNIFFRKPFTSRTLPWQQ